MIYMDAMYIMEVAMKVSKWGNSLAVRIPAEVAAKLGIKEGDDIELRASEIDGVELLLQESRRKRVERLREIMQGRLPDDYKFDREEANARR